MWSSSPAMTTMAQPGSHYHQLRREAELLAGGINSLSQRAVVYHHLFEHSAGNHVFPLIAAHGAMWAKGYFQLGTRLGSLLSLRHAASPVTQAAKLAQLNSYADAFRDINRRVCIETYTAYHFTAQCGHHAAAAELIPPALLEELNRCHAARRRGRALSVEQKRKLFGAFFLWEQKTIVGPAVTAATLAFDWPLMRSLALRPLIRFAYFPKLSVLAFKDFSCTAERIDKGFRAFDLAAGVGWDHVEKSARRYRVLPDTSFTGSAAHFATLRQTLCSHAQQTRVGH